VPVIATLPCEVPLIAAVQLVALVTDQVTVELPPLTTALGLALAVIAGADDAVTVTTADCAVLVPPVPVQVNV
jgi:hypothetical protein